jgi:hypothetical protein
VVLSLPSDPSISDSKKEELAAKMQADAKKIPVAAQQPSTTPLSMKIEKGKPDLGVLEVKQLGNDQSTQNSHGSPAVLGASSFLP